MSDRVTEIKERLAQATPGQWKMLDGWGPFHLDGFHRAARIGTDETPVFSPSGPYGAHDIIARKEDFEFVAYAAADIAYLLGELSGLRAERDRLKDENERLREEGSYAEGYFACWNVSADQDEVEALRAEHDRLRWALGMIVDGSNDLREVARRALAGEEPHE